MRYELLGGTHARVAHAIAAQRGQGTVEYVGLVLLVAVLIAGVVKATAGFDFTVTVPASTDSLCRYVMW